jgi:hypothetical protein
MDGGVYGGRAYRSFVLVSPPSAVLQLSKHLSPHSLYALATPEPTDDLSLDQEPIRVGAASDFGTRVAHTEVA